MILNISLSVNNTSRQKFHKDIGNLNMFKRCMEHRTQLQEHKYISSAYGTFIKTDLC